jgi:hypothetical protein
MANKYVHNVINGIMPLLRNHARACTSFWEGHANLLGGDGPIPSPLLQ